MDEPTIALRVPEPEEHLLRVRVNFGLFAGRHATPAELDDLAHALRELVPAFTLVSEERHEFADDVEAAVHQVLVEVPPARTAADSDVLAERIVLAAGDWASACIAARHGGGELV
jgi:hypothetical protein